ncbi:hypothetical protein AB0478_39970 [Streptomyces sp. NPDC051917]|uniref:hypothetical protein n=1 Tax=unclassified Streptomyces TaxID=2593676 RepID=UPI003445BEA3
MRTAMVSLSTKSPRPATRCFHPSAAVEDFGDLPCRDIRRGSTARGDGFLQCVEERRPVGVVGDLPDVLVTRLDVTDPASIETAVKETIGRFGAIDAVVNAAGYG